MKNANENCRGTTSKGWGQGENVSTETRKLDSAPQTTLQGGTTTLVGRAVIWPVMVRRSKLDSAPQTTLQGGTTTLVGRAVIWPVMVRRSVVLLIWQ